MPEREYQYLAIDYLAQLKDFIQPEDLEKIKNLILQKSWWDSTDSISGIVGYICAKFTNVKQEITNSWSIDENFWIRRVAIIFQLQYKNNTDTESLSKIISDNGNSNEFFICKAMGWALRQYSKTDKLWVKNFINTHTLHPLSVKEASKYL